MGLTIDSTGSSLYRPNTALITRSAEDKLIALAGNPNVGKSTIFNALTGLKQHTGNWPGKTVECKEGRFKTDAFSYILTDLPGTYSLMAHSQEEEIARDYLCFNRPDAIIVVCDAGCLERNLNLVLQILEINSSVILCLNLMDEAARRHISLDQAALSKRLGIPVVARDARRQDPLKPLLDSLDGLMEGRISCRPVKTRYPAAIEQAAAMLEPLLFEKQEKARKKEQASSIICPLPERWLSLRLLEGDPALAGRLNGTCGWTPLDDPEIREGLALARRYLKRESVSPEDFDQGIAQTLAARSERLLKGIQTEEKGPAGRLDPGPDRFLTGRWTAFPIMFLMLCGLFWLTIVGANIPSTLLAKGLFYIQDLLSLSFRRLGAPDWLHGILVLGMYRVLAWVVSVMLPPMAIFFPLFTLMEDAGLLPRIAYNLDKPFQACHACGKQCLSMAMGIGCNAAGVTGCRIIDSPRERTLAVLTNSLVPCNGRFPALISLLTMFFAGMAGGWQPSLLAAVMLASMLLLSVAMTFAMTRLLSATILKGMPSACTLELPPYRKPQIGKVLVRSLLDRTLFVLMRAVMVAAPAGALLWLLAYVKTPSGSLLQTAAAALDPAGRLLGMDGVILLAFLLGFPANEIVLPIMVMCYLSQASLSSAVSLARMHEIFLNHGWTAITALCTLFFTLFHWPCSTTLLTIKKETGSTKLTVLAALIPTACGILSCLFIRLLMNFVRIS